MKIFKQYIKIINYSLIGLVFGFSAFYILVNAYHYLEIRKDYKIDVGSQSVVVQIDEKINKIRENLSGYNASNYHGNISNIQMNSIYYNLIGCTNSFNNDTFKQIKTQNNISVIDVYNLRESYENDVLGQCIVNGLYWTTALDNNFGSKYLADNKEMIKLHINSLLNETSYLKKDLLNNSSYYFNTSIASSSIKDNTKDGFNEVMGAYNKALDFVDYISYWFKNEVEGNYD